MNHFQIQDFTHIPENDNDLFTGLITNEDTTDKFNDQINNAESQTDKNKKSIVAEINRYELKQQKLSEFKNSFTIQRSNDFIRKTEKENFESEKPKRGLLWPAAIFTLLFGIILILLSILIPASGWDAVGLALMYIMGSFLVYIGTLLALAAIIKVTLKPNQSKGRKALSIITFILLGIILAFLIYYLAVYIFNITLA